jgi:hypothetical protein
MQVFDKLSKPYFRFDTDANGDIIGEDYVFCDRARAAGFRIWCDSLLSREIGHIGQAVYRLPNVPVRASTPLSPHLTLQRIDDGQPVKADNGAIQKSPETDRD